MSLLLILGVVTSIFFIITFAQFSVDDSYITFRYARNFWEFGIWNWNPDKVEFVEAYTNPMYAFISLAPEYFGINPVLIFKFGNFCLFLFLVYLTHREGIKKYATFYLLIYPSVYIHMFSGLETFTFIFFYIYLYILLQKKEFHFNFYLLIFLFPFVRPEGLIFSLIYYYFSIEWKKPHVLRPALIIASAWIFYFIFRYKYFNTFLPNTFEVKGFSSLNYVLNNFLDFKFEFIFLMILFYLIKVYTFRTLIVATFCILLFYTVSDLQMNYANRFSFHVIFPIAIIYLTYFNETVKIPYKIILGILLIIFFGQSLYTSYREIRHQYSNSLYVLKNMAFNLQDFRCGRIMLLGDAGITPYISTWSTIDFIGLANRQIAMNKGISMSYLEKKDPDLIFLFASKKGGEDLFPLFNQNIILDYINLSKKLEKIGYITWHESYYYAVYLKKTDPNFNEIRNIILRAIEESKNDNITNERLVLNWAKREFLRNVLNFKYFKDELNFNGIKSNPMVQCN